MKLLHISDLHLGMILMGFSLQEDQIALLDQVVACAEREEVDGILISGDVYDRSVPPSEAVGVFDGFLNKVLALPKVPAVFIIYGNHDGGQRLSFGAEAMKRAGVFVSPVYQGVVEPVELSDGFGVVRFYLLPFLHPSQVEAVADGVDIASFQDGVRYAVEKMAVDTSVRNVLLTHQYVDGSKRNYETQVCESEHLQRGGTDLVDVSVVLEFDYVALGHLHSPQTIGDTNVRYCGSPMCYSKSEVGQKKSMTLVTLGEKGKVELGMIPFVPLHAVKRVVGTLEEIQKKAQDKEGVDEDYVYVELEDLERGRFVAEKLRKLFPRMLDFTYTQFAKREFSRDSVIGDVEEKSPFDVFVDFYGMQQGVGNEKAVLSTEQRDFMKDLMDDIWRDEE